MLTTKIFRKGTQLIATIDVITSVLTFISIFFLVFLTIAHGDRLELKVEKDRDEHPELAALFSLGRGPFVMIMFLLMSIYVCYFYLARYLLHAAYERSYTKIHRWCTLTLVIIITRAAFFITAVFFTPDRAVVSSFGLIGFLYQIFCLWFVRICEDRLRMEGNKMKFDDENTIGGSHNIETCGYHFDNSCPVTSSSSSVDTTGKMNDSSSNLYTYPVELLPQTSNGGGNNVGIGIRRQYNLHQNEIFHSRAFHEEEIHGQRSHLDTKE